MNILKEVLKHQVFPAMGCTEPVSVALCAAHAAKNLGGPVREALLILDPGTYKNGMGVNIPNTNHEKGNLLAGALGLLIAKPETRMEILKAATPSLVKKAKKLIADGKVKITVLPEKKTIHIETRLTGKNGVCTAVISDSHTEVTFLEINGRTVTDKAASKSRGTQARYKTLLGRLTVADMAALADKADRTDIAYIKKGVDMNLAASEAGLKLRKVGYYLSQLKKCGILQDDVFLAAKILASSATDARMDGLAIPVMSSGESGNQGVVATLVPYSFGKSMGLSDEKIFRSIALSHLMNAYVKLYTGGLAPICGCAIAAGVGATSAMVYQLKGIDPEAFNLAVNNIISDIGGMLCDGAKSGCSLKVVSSADAAIRSAYMAANHYGITDVEGFVGKTAEDTIKNLGRISNVGMGKVDTTIVDIMLGKQGMPSCLA